MEEQVLAGLVRRNEPEALVVAEPLDVMKGPAAGGFER
jgi:hypothetical protein